MLSIDFYHFIIYFQFDDLEIFQIHFAELFTERKTDRTINFYHAYINQKFLT